MVKSRSEREAELLALMRNRQRCHEVVDLYEKLTGLPDGKPTDVGGLINQKMIQAILDLEYPTDR